MVAMVMYGTLLKATILRMSDSYPMFITAIFVPGYHSHIERQTTTFVFILIPYSHTRHIAYLVTMGNLDSSHQ